MHHHLSLRGKLIIMLSVMASLFLVALDQTIIATALTDIVEDLDAYQSLSWIVTAYLLTTTVTVPIAGKLSDLFGRRLLLLIGVAVFAVSSLMSGLSGTIEQLLIWRAVQGIGGGIITANAFTIIGDLFAARERGRWQGLFGAVFGVSSVAGPLLGGWLSEGQNLLGFTTSWHWIFWINVPIAIVAFALIAIFCPSLKHAKKPRLDYVGAALLSLVLATAVLAVDNTDTIFRGVLDTFGLNVTQLRIIMAAIVVVALAAFIRVERTSKEPILPLRFFSNWNFSVVMGIATLFGAGFMGAIIYLTQFNQQVYGAGPTESGLMLVPMVAGILMASIGSGQIIARTGRYKIFMQVGIVLATVMVALLATLTPDTPYWHEAIMMTLVGFGLGFVMPVMNVAVQNEFKQSELGVATSSIQLFRGLGSTIGIAAFGALLTAGLTMNLNEASASQYVSTIKNSSTDERMANFDETSTLLALNTPAAKDEARQNVTAQFADAPQPVRQAALEKLRNQQTEFSRHIAEGFTESLRMIFISSAVMMAGASVLVFMMRERELKSSLPTTTPGEVNN